MKVIKDVSYEGERPLFGSCELLLKNVIILPGESALKHCCGIEVENCEFSGKYPFWHNEDVLITDSLFHEGARAAIWYVKNPRMMDTLVEAPKMFREIDGLFLENVKLPDAQETCWNCRNVELYNVEAHKGDYIFMNNTNMKIDGFLLQGNYSFQYAKNVEIRNAELHTKDAFWHSENVTVFDSVLDGEYLGWHSHNLRLVNCKISGTQPLCYAHNLVMENCTMAEDADLAFEYSTVHAQINGHVTSVKNPDGGHITAGSIGEIITDEHFKNPGTCKIETGK
ncbi:MAG: DUF3737 family protein [Phocaeicola dorei]|nr:DUF3737 family protein [Phocaeicola dorei]